MGRSLGIWPLCALLTALTGCAADATGAQDDGTEDDVAPSGDSGAGTGTAAQALSGTQTIFVNFAGPTISNCGNYCSNATTNHSYIIGYAWGKSSVNFAPYTDTKGRTAIVSYLKSFFSKYDVVIKTARPASGPYTMVVITPTYWAHHGIAPLDCGNANKKDIAFVVRTGDTGFYPSYKKIAQAAAHELGHSFGLAHVKNTSDFMQWASSGSAFIGGNYDTAHPSGKCISGTYQNDVKLLSASIGLK
jgi:hypothetical protein